MDATEILQGRAVQNGSGAVDFEPVQGELLRARLEGNAALGLVLHRLNGFQPNGHVDEGLSFFGVKLFAGEQIADVAGLFRFKIHPKRARHNPARNRPYMNAFFGGIQGITLLRRNAIGEHQVVSKTAAVGGFQSKSKQFNSNRQRSGVASLLFCFCDMLLAQRRFFAKSSNIEDRHWVKTRAFPISASSPNLGHAFALRHW